MNKYEQLGQWVQQNFQIEVVVCKIYGKRWAFEWSSGSDIENAERIQLTPSTGIIVPATSALDKKERIAKQALAYWQNN
ncbi:MAG: hypothetical protein R6U85_02740 [Salinivirgaceae bacterium]